MAENVQLDIDRFDATLEAAVRARLHKESGEGEVQRVAAEIREAVIFQANREYSIDDDSVPDGEDSTLVQARIIELAQDRINQL